MAATPYVDHSSRTSAPQRSVSGPVTTVVAALAISGVAAALLAAWFGGALAGLAGFEDGGPVALWGVPISKALHDVFAAVTIGLLLLAGTIIPERGNTDRRRTACTVAVATGVVWLLAGAAQLVLLISNVSGIEISSPLFLGQLGFIWSIELFRIYAISWLFALGSVTLAAFARQVTPITWAAALGVIALAVLALAGHAAGAAAHDTAVNSLAVHIIAASVWLGGLCGLIILRPIMGKDFAVAVERFSVLAGWAYGGVLVSGVLAGSLRLSSFSDITSRYGLMLCVKVSVLVLLGLAGLHMRRRFVGNLREGNASSWAFAQFALMEVLLMGAAMGTGVGLGRTEPPVAQAESTDVATAITGYPLPDGPIVGLDWITTFRIDWLFFFVVVLAIALYLAGVRKLNRRGDSWATMRTVSWVAGWLIFFWVTSGAPGVYGRIMFSAHMLQHMTLAMLIPIFLVLGAPLTLASRTIPARKDKTLGPREILLRTSHSRWMRFWTMPIVGAINFVGSIYIFYFTDLFALALTTHVGHIAMVVHFMASGYVFAWSLIGIDPGPNRWPPSLRLVLLFATMAFHAFFGVAIMTASVPIAGEVFGALQVPWVDDLIADQQVGGGITWAIGEIPMLILALAVAVVWMRSDEGEARRNDRQAERDDDAALRAYNEELQRLAGQRQRHDQRS